MTPYRGKVSPSGSLHQWSVWEVGILFLFCQMKWTHAVGCSAVSSSYLQGVRARPSHSGTTTLYRAAARPDADDSMSGSLSFVKASAFRLVRLSYARPPLFCSAVIQNISHPTHPQAESKAAFPVYAMQNGTRGKEYQRGGLLSLSVHYTITTSTCANDEEFWMKISHRLVIWYLALILSLLLRFLGTPVLPHATVSFHRAKRRNHRSLASAPAMR